MQFNHKEQNGGAHSVVGREVKRCGGHVVESSVSRKQPLRFTVGHQEDYMTVMSNQGTRELTQLSPRRH